MSGMDNIKDEGGEPSRGLKRDGPGQSAAAVAVVGGGPAGLMAAEVLSSHGIAVDLYDAMPSVGRKFLLAGRGGLNLSHAEDQTAFLSRYGARESGLAPMLNTFGAAQTRGWAEGLGIETFVGTSGRVFPTEMKAAPLLRAWLHRLRGAGVRIHVRHRWEGWAPDGSLLFDHAGTGVVCQPQACVLALGGASWQRLGSTGKWVPVLEDKGLGIAPLKPSNCGFDAAGGWSDHLRSRFAGQPVKPVVLSLKDSAGKHFSRQGEFVLTGTGIEGSLVYAASAMIREEIARTGHADIELDVLPDRSLEQVQRECAAPRGSRTVSDHLRRRLGLQGLKLGLMYELLDKSTLADPLALGAALKHLRLRLCAARPIDEAISTAGGLRFEDLDAGLMLKALPGVFACGEMLDWEAPTGGYLLTACLSTGHAAGQGVLRWLRARNPEKP